MGIVKAVLFGLYVGRICQAVLVGLSLKDAAIFLLFSLSFLVVGRIGALASRGNVSLK